MYVQTNKSKLLLTLLHSHTMYKSKIFDLPKQRFLKEQTSYDGMDFLRYFPQKLIHWK